MCLLPTSCKHLSAFLPLVCCFPSSVLLKAHPLTLVCIASCVLLKDVNLCRKNPSPRPGPWAPHFRNWGSGFRGCGVWRGGQACGHWTRQHGTGDLRLLLGNHKDEAPLRQDMLWDGGSGRTTPHAICPTSISSNRGKPRNSSTQLPRPSRPRANCPMS